MISFTGKCKYDFDNIHLIFPIAKLEDSNWRQELGHA